MFSKDMRWHTLRATLGVERPDIVIDDSWGFLEDALVECLSPERWNLLDINSNLGLHTLPSKPPSQVPMLLLSHVDSGTLRTVQTVIPFGRLGANSRRA